MWEIAEIIADGIDTVWNGIDDIINIIKGV